LVLGSIGSENRIYSRTLQQIKKILRLDDTDNIKKIISKFYFSFSKKKKPFCDALEDFTTDEINKKNPT
jgi:hypothetical protein